MSASVSAGVSAVEVLRRRFRDQLAAYRTLVDRAVDHGGALSESDAAELVSVCDALSLPPARFAQDCSDVMQLRSLEARLDETRTRNATPIADVPRLEAEIAELSKERMRIRDEADTKCKALDEQAAARRREIRKEEQRFREPTDRIEREVIEIRDYNPVLFRREPEPSEWANMLLPRKRTIRT